MASTLTRRIFPLIALLIALGLLADTARILMFPPGRTDVGFFEDVRIEVEVDHMFVWAYGDCVSLRYAVLNAVAVTVNGQPSPSIDEREYCILPEPPLTRETAAEPGWNTGAAEDFYVTVNQYPDVVVAAQVHDEIDTFIHVSAPIYVLSADLLWLWRVGLAAGLLFSAGYVTQVRWVRRTVVSVERFARRNRVMLAIGGVLVATAVVFSSQFAPLILLIISMLRFATENGFVPMVVEWGSVLQTAGVLAAFGIASWLLGVAVMLRFVREPFEGRDFGLLAMGLVVGQSLSALIFVVLAIFDALNPVMVVVTLIVSSGMGLPYLPEIMRRIQRSGSQLSRIYVSESFVWKLLIVLCVVMLIVPWFRVLSDVNWDGHTTYMTQTKLIALTGGLREPARELNTEIAVFGFAGEATMGAVYMLAGDAAARMHSWWVYIAALGAGLALAGELHFSRRGQLIALVAMVTSSLLYGTVGWGKVDNYALAPGVAAIVLTLMLSHQPRPLLALLIGLLAGVAVNAKITYIVGLGVMIPLLTIFLIKPRDLPYTWLLMVIGALMPLGLIVLKNAVVLSEPLAPLLYSDAPTDSIEFGITSSRERLLRNLYVVYPLTWYGTFSSSTLVYLTPLWLILLPLLIWYGSHPQTPRRQWVVLWGAAFAYLVWAFSYSNIIPLRYQAELLIVFVVMGGQAFAVVLERVKTPVIRWALVSTLFFAFGMTFANEVALSLSKLTLPAVRNDCRPSPADQCDGLAVLNETAPIGSGVLTNMPLYYHLRDDLLLCRADKATHIDLLAMSSMQRWEHAYANGYSYILDWRLEGIWHQVGRQYLQMFPVVPWDPAASPTTLDITTVYDGDLVRLYYITSVDGVDVPTPDCVPTWEWLLQRPSSW